MRVVTLLLNRKCLDNGTFGVLYAKDLVLYTVERPWLSNKPFKSCIPPGRYKIHKHHSEDHPNSFYLENPDLGVTLSGPSTRTAILIHIGNFVENVVGCIAPGLELHPSTWGVANSGLAMIALNDIIDFRIAEYELLIIQ